MPAVVIRRSDIGPSAACQRPEDPYAGYEFGEDRVPPLCHNVPEKDEGEAGTWAHTLVASRMQICEELLT